MASQQSLGDFVSLSGAVRGLAVELSKIANDLRLLSSGPHTGLDEIELPALQPGSSIMPGKVNPVVAEMLNMVCFHVIGHDVAITMAGEAGQLELNVMLPYVAYALLDSLDVLTHAVATFDTRTVRLLKAHPERCAYFAERTVGAATALNDELGFQGAAEVAQEAIRSGRTVAEVVAERGAQPARRRRPAAEPSVRSPAQGSSSVTLVPSPGHRRDVELAADDGGALAHPEQAEAPPAPARTRPPTTTPATRCRCPRRIRTRPALLALEHDLHRGGGGVLVDVVQRFLDDAEGLRLDVAREADAVEPAGPEARPRCRTWPTSRSTVCRSTVTRPSSSSPAGRRSLSRKSTCWSTFRAASCTDATAAGSIGVGRRARRRAIRASGAAPSPAGRDRRGCRGRCAGARLPAA